MSIRVHAAVLLVALLAGGCSTTRVCCTGGDLVHDGDDLVAAYEHRIDGRVRPVFVFGDDGPPVLLLHELPGLTPETVRLARFLDDQGFVVHLPLLFGRPLERAAGWNFVTLALDGDWNVTTAERTSPVIDDLRGLVDEVARRHGGADARLGVIGMCLTGTAPLALMSDPRVVAPVLAQPALPAPASLCDASARAIDLSPADVAHARARVTDEDLTVFALRFATDDLSPTPRFERLAAIFGERFDGHTVGAAEAAAAGLPRDAHATLTEYFSTDPRHPIGRRLPLLVAFLRDALAGA